MIRIKKSKNADTRTCDVTKVSREELIKNTLSHIRDVKSGMEFLIDKLEDVAIMHDYTKLNFIDKFYDDFKNGFKEGHTSWWEMHQTKERHHLKDEKYVHKDVNLIDILEMIVDGVIAGLARSGQYRKEEIPDSLLRKAFDNTIELMLKNTVVEEGQ